MSFNSSGYYILFNPSLLDEANTQYALHAGVYLKPFGQIGVAPNSLSSQNWQLFPQGGRWFIRNYDYGPGYQLGLTAQSGGVPAMVARNGSLGQQWSIIQADGGYRLTNGLLGNGTALAIPSNTADVAMQAASIGTTWNITINPGFGPETPESYSEVENFEISSSSSSSSSATSSSLENSSATSASPLLSSGSASTSPTNSPNSNTSISPAGSSSPALGAGAIAGIVIGAVAVLAFIIFGFWFFARKRKATANAYELQGNQEHVEKYAYRAELNAPKQVWESDSRERRVELP